MFFHDADFFVSPISGHDTTSASIAWTMHLLGSHPEIQERLYQEVQEVMGDEKDLSYEMLGQLKYLEMVLKESLRLYPSVPGIGRVLTEDVDVEGVTIPAGTQVMVSIFSLHHNSKYWPEPEKFDPERWTPENSEGRDPYQYVPFSAGYVQISWRLLLLRLTLFVLFFAALATAWARSLRRTRRRCLWPRLSRTFSSRRLTLTRRCCRS